jgi:cholesterol oxidase
MANFDYDYAIIGSGFGGSVSALRLAEKGYKVLVIEKGKWFKAEDFPKTNWNLKKWMWEPRLGLQGFFKMTFLNHATVVHGVGVGGGSLTYANTLPVPKKKFFNSGSWAQLADWETELNPYYELAFKMLGAEMNPKLHDADLAIKELARQIGKEDKFEATKVAVYFGEPGETVEDPYFDGKGPDRTGCIHCGACMTGCKHNAKNTLDKNYLYLAQKLGVEILAEKEVIDVKALETGDTAKGYKIQFQNSLGWKKKKTYVTSKGVIFSGGVLGTVPLLLKLKKSSLPGLSEQVGAGIRTNNESLMVVTSTKEDNKDYSKGIAIGSILHTDENSHLEPTRYGKGSSFFRIMIVPLRFGRLGILRILKIFGLLFTQPKTLLKTIFIRNYSRRSTILLFMQTLDSTIRLTSGKVTKLKTVKEEGPAPSAFIPEARSLSKIFGQIVKGIPFANFTDVLLGIPSTAHILGGAIMGKDSTQGVIDKENKVFGYEHMYVCDGSMISANPGVNPALSITAISERAIAKIPRKDSKLMEIVELSDI